MPFCCISPIIVQAQKDDLEIIKLTKDSLAIAKDLFSKNQKLGEPIAVAACITAANAAQDE